RVGQSSSLDEWVGRAVGDDAAGGDLAHAGKGVELLEGGGVQVKGSGRGGRAGRGVWRRRGCGVAGAGDADLLAVGEPAGQVDGVQVGAGGAAPGGPDGR